MRSTQSLFLTIIAILAGAVLLYGQDTVDVESVNLDKDRIYAVCPWPRRKRAECMGEQAIVKVSTAIRGANKKGLPIYYIPSGGKIVGTGAEVIWDLSEAHSGKYTVAVGVGADDVIKGTVITKTLTVEECPVCDPPCYCPTLNLVGPTGAVRAGDAFVVRANVAGGDKLTCKWTVSTGVVVDSAYAQSILVNTTKQDAGKDITVSLELGGMDPACNCPREDSVTIHVQKR